MFGVCLFFFWSVFCSQRYIKSQSYEQAKEAKDRLFFVVGEEGLNFMLKILSNTNTARHQAFHEVFFNFYFLKKVGLKSAGLFIYFEGLCTFDDMSLISSHTRLSRISAITSVSYPSSQSAALFWTLLLEPQTLNDSLLM